MRKQRPSRRVLGPELCRTKASCRRTRDDTSKLAVGSAEGQAKSRFEASLLCTTKASCRRTRASWQLAAQKGRQSQGLELVSSRFRKWRLAVWAMGRAPDPSFTAMMF